MLQVPKVHIQTCTGRAADETAYDEATRLAVDPGSLLITHRTFSEGAYTHGDRN